jgi:hypothetical protein
MATRKKKIETISTPPIVESPAELQQYEIDWNKLAKNVREALEEHERQKLVEEAPYHPGYEGAVVKPEKPKTKKIKTK